LVKLLPRVEAKIQIRLPKTNFFCIMHKNMFKKAYMYKNFINVDLVYIKKF